MRPQVVVEAVFRRAHRRFALPEAGAHHRSKIVVHDVLRGEVHAVRRARGFRDHELHRRILRDRARPLHIEVCFCFFAASQISRCGAVVHEHRIVRRQPEVAAEILHVRKIDVRAPHDRDRLAAAVRTAVVQRRDVVDLREIRRRQVMRAARRRVVRIQRLRTRVHRLGVEAVQALHAKND